MIAGWLPQNVSTFGGDIDWVFRLILYVVGVWFILAEGTLLYFVLRYRRRNGRTASFNRGETWRELAWIFIPAVIVLVLDFGIDAAGGPVWDKVKEELPPATIEVKVKAKQFNWEFTYAGPDGKFGTADDITQENEMHVPVNQVVRLTLTSGDVIHSFFVPNLRLKQDVVPGRTIPAWFEDTRLGSYPIACTELCGFGHYSMAGTLIVQTAQDYAQWLKEHSTQSTASADTDRARKAN